MTSALDYTKLNYINFSQKELEELISASKEGNTAAFEKLSGFVRHISYSYFVSKMRQGRMQNKEDVDDLTNNVFISFAEQYHRIENLEFWLRRVLYLNYINWYKKQKSRHYYELEDFHHLEDKTAHPGDAVDAQKITALIDTLPADKQKILKMRFWDDMKFSEIAEKLGKSEDAVKKMFYRSIEELKNKL